MSDNIFDDLFGIAIVGTYGLLKIGWDVTKFAVKTTAKVVSGAANLIADGVTVVVDKASEVKTAISTTNANNNEARRLCELANSEYESARQATLSVAERLFETRKNGFSALTSSLDFFKTIRNMPSLEELNYAGLDLPPLNATLLKSDNMQIQKLVFGTTTGGVTGSALAFLLGGPVLLSGAIGAGIGYLLTANKLRRDSEANLEAARNQYNHIHYDVVPKLNNASKALSEYNVYLNRFITMLHTKNDSLLKSIGTKTDYRSFTYYERKIVENCYLLSRVINKFIRLNICDNEGYVNNYCLRKIQEEYSVVDNKLTYGY